MTGVVGVVGTGLIGTSIGLALSRLGDEVLLTDADPARAATAAALGAGRDVDFPAIGECDHVVVAVPPADAVPVINAALRLNDHLTVSDVTSTKSNLVHEVETFNSDLSRRFCGGHPVAGRERGGPAAAQPELFEGAVWVICPTSATADAARDAAVRLAERCGARTLVVDAETHDRVLAAVSHAPQLVASALATRLATSGAEGPALAGQGFRDTTRLADSDPDLWAGIVAGNATHVATELRALAGLLGGVAEGLVAGETGGVAELVARGRRARALLPGKAAAPRPAWARVGVVLEDRPGELARLFAAAGTAGVNIEDVAIEHAPDHPVGYVDLDVRPEAAPALLDALRAAGWPAHRSD